MPHLHRHDARESRTLRPGGPIQGPPHVARQLEVASRLTPAEDFRAHVALLVSCGDGAGLHQAKEALCELCPLDAIHALPLPAESWADVMEGAPGTTPWLERYVMREVNKREPSLVALLEHCRPDGSRDPDVHAFAERLRSWDPRFPVAVVRSRVEAEWAAAPEAKAS